MLIIAGRLQVDSSDRDHYVRSCEPIVQGARRTPGCLDFAITADPLEPDRVNVYERWASDDALTRFRESGPDVDLGDRIRAADVWKYRISHTEDPGPGPVLREGSTVTDRDRTRLPVPHPCLLRHRGR